MTAAAPEKKPGASRPSLRLSERLGRVGRQLSGQLQAHFADEIGDLRGSGRGLLRRLARSSAELRTRLGDHERGPLPARLRDALDQIGQVLERWSEPEATSSPGGMAVDPGHRQTDARPRRPKGTRPRRRRRAPAAEEAPLAKAPAGAAPQAAAVDPGEGERAEKV